MKFDKPKCPQCGAPPRGTIDRLQGCAELNEPDENGEFEYSGSTEVWWDEQRSIIDMKGRVALICHEGHEWFSRKDGE
jgi:hypothetical protein